MPDVVTHIFELAGLGKAPFRFVGVKEVWHQAHYSAPKKPGSACDLCGHAIAECCFIASADGRQFKVGNDCVKKTGDAGLRNITQRAINKLKRDKQALKDAALVDEYDGAMRQFLHSTPGAHPNEYYASQGKTIGDYLLFGYTSSGTASKAKSIRKHKEALDKLIRSAQRIS